MNGIQEGDFKTVKHIDDQPILEPIKIEYKEKHGQMTARIRFSFFNGREWKEFEFGAGQSFYIDKVNNPEKYKKSYELAKQFLKDLLWQTFRKMMEEGTINIYETPEGEEEKELVKHSVMAVARYPIITRED